MGRIRQIATRSRRKAGLCRHGAIVVEFAICLPILLVIFFALMEYSRLEMIRQTTKSSAFQGARTGIITGATEQEMIDVTTSKLSMAGVRGATINATLTDTSAEIDVRVPIRQNSFVPPTFSRDMEIRSRIILRREGVDVNRL